MSLGPDEWTMVSPWDGTLSCTGMPYGFSNNPHPALSWGARAGMAGMNGEAEGFRRRELDAASPDGWGLGSKEARCQSHLGFQGLPYAEGMGAHREEVTWSQSHACYGTAQARTQFWLANCDYNARASRERGHGPFPPHPLWVLGFEKAGMWVNCGYAQHCLLSYPPPQLWSQPPLHLNPSFGLSWMTLGTSLTSLTFSFFYLQGRSNNTFLSDKRILLLVPGIQRHYFQDWV